MCRSNGFTLLELLIALAVLVTLLVIGVPSYSRVQEERQLEQAINQMQSDVLLGRQMAWHQHDSQIQIRFFPGDNWCYRLTDVSPQQCVICLVRQTLIASVSVALTEKATITIGTHTKRQALHIELSWLKKSNQNLKEWMFTPSSILTMTATSTALWNMVESSTMFPTCE